MIIATANQKGGSGKSTTAAAIVSGATFHGSKALAIDLDPQCNLTYFMGGKPNTAGAYEFLTAADTSDTIQHTEQGDIIPGSTKLAAADTSLKGTQQRVYGSRNALEKIKDNYDVIVIDTPPTLGTLLINALAAADGVIIPLRAKIVNLQGLYLLADTIKQTREKYNPDLKIYGALITEYNGRTNAAKEVADTIRERAAALNIPVFKTEIRQGVAVDESQILQESLFEYAPKSNPAKDYFSFLAELGV